MRAVVRPLARALVALALALAGAAALPVGGPAAPAAAQTTAQNAAPDYEAWRALATRAEDIVAAERASTDALEALRAQLVEWRGRFQTVQSASQSRIATLQAQIEALGPPPGEGESEPTEIAERRSELNQQLANARAPVLTADEAFRRADGLIHEIDSIIRERTADRLLRLGPSPLNPTIWPDAYRGLADVLAELVEEVEDNWSSAARRAVLQQNLALVALLLAVAAVLLTRGRSWLLGIIGRLAPSSRTLFAREIRWILLSLTQIAVPILGLVALTAAIRASALPGSFGDQLVATLPLMGWFLFSARWLGGLLFPASDEAPQFLPLRADDRAAGRGVATWLGALLAAAVLITGVADHRSFPDEMRPVLGFPVIVVMGIMLVRLGRLLRRAAVPPGHEPAGEEERRMRDRTLQVLARAVGVVGYAGPVLAAIGYFNAGGFFVFPSVMTVSLMGILVVLQRLVVNIYALLVGADEETGVADALIPVLVGLVLVLASIPVFALIWGARVTQLMEIWAWLRDGVTVGETRISVQDVLTFLVVFAAGYMLTRLVQGTLRSSVLPKTRLDVGGREAVVTGTGYVGIFLAALVAITTAGIDLSSLAIVAGALSVGIGFGLQNIVSNFVSGIILLIERPIKKGDWIEVGGFSGYVRDISVRSTQIETFDRATVVIPNADLVSGSVTNWTHGNDVGRAIVPVGVAYGTDTKRVETILREIAEAHPMVILNPPPAVLFMGFGADSLDFEIRAILRDVNWVLSVKSDLNHEIARRFAEEGIEIPFAQRDVWLRNPEALHPPAAAATEATKEAE